MVRVCLLSSAVLLLATADCFGLGPFDPSNLWHGFERRLADSSANVQRRMSPLRDRISTIGTTFDSLSRAIEEQVQETLPQYMKEESKRRRTEDTPIEAVVGSLGDGAVDDGLQVYLEGDEEHPLHLKNEFLDDIDAEAAAADANEEESTLSEVPTSSPFNPLFGMRFNFNNGFSNGFAPFPSFRWNSNRNNVKWWQGENVCIEETEIDEPETEEPDAEVTEGQSSGNRTGRFFTYQMESTSCGENGDSYSCTTRTIKRGINRTVRKKYQCCHGYSKTQDGCTELNIKQMTETLRELGLQQFLTNAQAYGLSSAMLDSKNITVFAPTNEAFSDFIFDMQERNDVDITDNEILRRKKSFNDMQELSPVLKTHVAEGIIYTADMIDEQIVPTLSATSSMRINIYPSSPVIITMNCARIVSSDLQTTNGIIHTLDRVAVPAKKSISEIIENDPQFTTLKDLLNKSPLLTQLAEDGQYTFFAPTDAAFAALPEGELDLIANTKCLEPLLMNHILPNVICSAAITNPRSKTINLLDKYLKVQLQETGKILINDAQVVAKDIIATNGVIHIIDAPLIPNEVIPVSDALRKQNLTMFLDLIEAAGMVDELHNLSDVAIFVPNNRALSEQLEYLEELKANPEELKSVIRHHITQQPITDASIRNNHLVDTQAVHPFRINLYSGPLTLSLDNLFSRSMGQRMRLTAGCARVTLTDQRACGGSIHVVDRLMTTPKGHIMETLENDPTFSIFREIAKNSSLAEEYTNGVDPLTVLAPSDHVFKTLPQEELDSLLEDEHLKDQLVRRHTLREHMCCAGISPYSFLREQMRTAHGSTIEVYQSPNGLLKAGNARITTCGSPSTNGVVHTVNRLFVEPHVVDSNPNRRWVNERVKRFPFQLPNIASIFGH